MDEPPARAIGSVTRYVHQVADDAASEAVEDHERRCHAIPSPRSDPVDAIPFPDVALSDDDCSHAIEWLEEADELTVAGRLQVPVPALRLALADYERRFGKFLYLRARD